MLCVQLSVFPGKASAQLGSRTPPHEGTVVLHHLFTLLAVWSAATVSLKSSFLFKHVWMRGVILWSAVCRVVLLPLRRASSLVMRCAPRLQDQIERCTKMGEGFISSALWLNPLGSKPHVHDNTEKHPRLSLTFSWTLTYSSHRSSWDYFWHPWGHFSSWCWIIGDFQPCTRNESICVIISFFSKMHLYRWIMSSTRAQRQCLCLKMHYLVLIGKSLL